MGPLAERLRPRTLDDYVGQAHLVGENGVIRKMIASRNLSSFILWGPPGVGKTTLASVISNELKKPFYTLSAVTAGVKEVREVIDRAEKDRLFAAGSVILFIDEIHRFNKSQQDSLLGAVERGTITLIGATTENPSFEVIRPLLSRCQVYTLEPLGDAEMNVIIDRALQTDTLLSGMNIELRERDALVHYAGGDARRLLNSLELVVNSLPWDDGAFVITNDRVVNVLQQSPVAYDKGGEMHYDIISAFIKSIRGSDPDAAVYWMARMIEGGEDPVFIARRLVISAAEDIGLANPNALLLANAAFDAVTKIGWPEARIPLAEAAVYLASSPKSNSAYLAIGEALAQVKRTGNLPVPLHLRNAPTELMKKMGYAKGYDYPHDFPGHFVRQDYMPDDLRGTCLWTPQANPSENKMKERLEHLWNRKYEE